MYSVASCQGGHAGTWKAAERSLDIFKEKSIVGSNAHALPTRCVYLFFVDRLCRMLPKPMYIFKLHLGSLLSKSMPPRQFYLREPYAKAGSCLLFFTLNDACKR